MKKGVKIFFSCSLAAMIFIASSISVFANPGGIVDPTVMNPEPTTTQEGQ